MPEPRYPSPLAHYAGTMRDPDPDGARKAARELWLQEGGVAFTASQLREMAGLDRQLLIAAAERHYGKRKA